MNPRIIIKHDSNKILKPESVGTAIAMRTSGAEIAIDSIPLIGLTPSVVFAMKVATPVDLLIENSWLGAAPTIPYKLQAASAANAPSSATLIFVNGPIDVIKAVVGSMLISVLFPFPVNPNSIVPHEVIPVMGVGTAATNVPIPV